MGPAARPHGPGTDRGAKRPLLRADPDPEGAQRGEGRVALHKHIYRESGCESAEPESPTHAVRRCVSVWYREGTPIAQVCDAVPCCVELCIPCVYVCSLKGVQVPDPILKSK